MQPPQDEPARRGFSSVTLGAQARADLLAQIAQMVDSGKIKVVVNRAFPLDEAQAALDYRLATKAPGKIVITVV
jgi:NADPH:quinone reductase-like Zn-dependent oxidoreductase